MILFIDDRPIHLVGPKSAARRQDTDEFDRIIDARLEPLKPFVLQGHVLILNVTPATVEKLVHLLNTNGVAEINSITLVTSDKKAAEEKLKSLYKIVKAAGGVVFKDSKMLFIFRRGKWDLPKGKLDDGESSRAAAGREVEEETGVKVALEERICTTWHTYTFNGSRILKRTRWYRMICLDDSRMQPQEEEDIEQIEWLDRRKAQRALTNSFSSIRYVIESVGQEEPKE